MKKDVGNKGKSSMYLHEEYLNILYILILPSFY